jgi:hypothetical protein
LKGFLTVPQTVLAAVLTILLMLGISVLWSNRAAARAGWSVGPERVSGD